MALPFDFVVGQTIYSDNVSESEDIRSIIKEVNGLEKHIIYYVT